MADRESAHPCLLSAEAEIDATVFLSAFERRVREAAPRMANPDTGQPVKLRLPLKVPALRIGNTVCAEFSGALFGQSPMQLVALTLCREGFEASPGGCVPARTLLQRLKSPDGLILDDKTKYIVGIFSPFGWPDHWTEHSLSGVNSEIHLVSRVSGRWKIVSPRGSEFGVFFNPDTGADGQERAARGLDEDEGLRQSGDQVSMDAFCNKWSTTPDAVKAAVEAASGRFLLVTHRGKTVVQRRYGR